MKHASRPTIVDVARGLQALGHTSMALGLMRAVGIQEIPVVAEVVKKYQREKIRSAYIHVKLDVDADAQEKLLKDFHDKLVVKTGFSWLPPCDTKHLLKIALPGPRVVVAYRIDLKEYLKSGLSDIVAKSNHLEAYTRKPRVDAQKHCLNQES